MEVELKVQRYATLFHHAGEEEMNVGTLLDEYDLFELKGFCFCETCKNGSDDNLDDEGLTAM